MTQRGFFDFEERLASLSKAGDPLEGLAQTVDFEIFRKSLDKALKYSDRRRGGRPPHDPVMMFKVLILQALYDLSDDKAEFMIRDRLSFMRFLGLGLGDVVPDAKTIWLFRERLKEKAVIEKLFDRFDRHLEDQGLLALGGQIMDASIIEAPRQRNNDGEKEAIKAGEIPTDWQDKPAKLRQKDRDARWTMKRGRRKDSQSQLMVPAFGYKSHINIDQRHGLIRTWTVTNAAAHDGARLPELLDHNNFSSKVWADTAYRSNRNEELMEKRGRKSMVHFRRKPGKDLTHQQKRANAARSKIRSKVEHVFAHQKSRTRLFIRSIGIDRARFRIGMANIVYNMQRMLWLEKQQAKM